VTLLAPDVPGVYDYTIDWDRRLLPAGAGDTTAIRGPTRILFELTVVPSTPPTLVLPSDIAAEGNAPGGATVGFTVGATDAEDDPDPTPTCSADSGDFFPLGDTTVECEVTDSTGLTGTGSFTISVADTTAPTLVGLPANVDLTTEDPAGTTAAYSVPTATDEVDPSPVVGCLPAPGAAVPTGTTTVTCTATDASGNEASGSFPLNVTYVAPPPPDPGTDYDVKFWAPVGRDEYVRVKAGRVIPVRVRILADGKLLKEGAVTLVLDRCDGTPLDRSLDLRRVSRHWVGSLDTKGLSGCVMAELRVDGVYAGDFQVDVKAPKPPKPPKPARGHR
jgi:hypothetical protein